MLADLARATIEAALEAELVEHLGYAKYDSSGRLRGSNSRNGSRAKVVSTVLGPLRIDVPRDRWGTFDPMTVGKWQRTVVGVDRVLVPIAAKDAPMEATVALLRSVYPRGASERTLRRIASLVRDRLATWHTRTFSGSYLNLELRRCSLRDRRGIPAGFPVVRVVGTCAPQLGESPRRELLSLQAAPAIVGAEPWQVMLSELRRRGVHEVHEVRAVAGDGGPDLDQLVARLWPEAVLTTIRLPA
jgi:putative transposase